MCLHCCRWFTHITAGTHGGWGFWIMYPVIGSFIGVLLTVVQHWASLSAEEKPMQVSRVPGCLSLNLLCVNVDRTCWSKVHHSQQDGGHQSALHQASTLDHFNRSWGRVSLQEWECERSLCSGACPLQRSWWSEFWVQISSIFILAWKAEVLVSHELQFSFFEWMNELCGVSTKWPVTLVIYLRRHWHRNEEQTSWWKLVEKKCYEWWCDLPKLLDSSYLLWSIIFNLSNLIIYSIFTHTSNRDPKSPQMKL